MAYLAGYTKPMLTEVALELGERVDSPLTVIKLKKIILQSEEYEDTVRLLLEQIRIRTREARARELELEKEKNAREVE